MKLTLLCLVEKLVKSKLNECKYYKSAFQWNAYRPLEGGSAQGVSAGTVCPGGACSGGCLPRGCLLGGVSQHAMGQTPPPVDRQTPVKT